MTRYDGLYVIGIDPGPVPGIITLACSAGRVQGVSAFQCLAADAPILLGHLLDGIGGVFTLVAIEAFVVRRAAGKTGRAGTVTRDLIGQFEREAGFRPGAARTVQRSAAAVKPWATDKRLAAVKVQGTDLLDVVSHVGRHARDAARHAIYCAVHDVGIPDPLSRAANTQPNQED